MSEFTPEMIIKPEWFSLSPLTGGFGRREPYVIGFDSEAHKGKPISLQFSTPDHGDGDADIIWTNSKHALSDFLDYLEPIAKEYARKRAIIVVGWNLSYEYTQLFRQLPPQAWESSQLTIHVHNPGEECTGNDNDWHTSLDILNEKRYTFRVHFSNHRDTKGGKRRDRYPVRVLDGMAFFTTSLEKVASIVGVDGKTDFDAKGELNQAEAKRSEPFRRYAKRDAWITRKAGEVIVSFHRNYDVPMTISAPMFASHVFRRRYLDGEIPLCDPELEEAGLRSYHGGKNGLYIDRPTIFEGAYDYDINAAYTGAMSALPNPVTSTWENAYHYEPDVHGIFYVRARVASCVYRFAQDVAGRWHTWKEDGDLGWWTTSYELDAALGLGEVHDIYECTGFIMRGEPGRGSLRRYCDEMSALKKNAETLEIRTMAKLCLNSLYGKLIQKVPTGYDSIFPLYDLVEGSDGTWLHRDGNMVPGGYRAGGLYHPALASLVTGFVRARVHKLEHKYRSLMTSTDGFLSQVAPDPTDLGNDVGSLKVSAGRVTIWRERLYVFDPSDGSDPKFALHGFRGKLPDLRAIPVAPGAYDYRASHMVTLRESRRKLGGRRWGPGEFADLPLTLDLTTIGDRSPIK